MSNPKSQVAILAVLAFAASGCRLLGGRPAPEGLNEVKSVGRGSEEWKDDRGGVWRLQEGKRLDWEDAKSSCQKFAKATGKRWRLPSPEELVEVRGPIASPQRNNAFGWVKLGNTWAAEWETAVDENVAGVYVDMETGEKHATLYDDLKYTTACVRTDSQGSTWADDKGRDWWFIEARMPFETAEVTCEELARRRHQTWRLPSPEELKEAILSGIQTDKNKAFGRDYLAYTWSNQVAPILDSSDSFAIDLRNGKSHLVDVDEDLSVVCVTKSDGTTKASASK